MRKVVVSLENLMAGLVEWDRFSATSNWAADLHNAMYARHAVLKSDGH